MKVHRGPEALCYVTVSGRNCRSTKQAWRAQNFTAGFTQAVYEKTSKAGVFANSLKHIYKLVHIQYIDCSTQT